MTMNSINSSIPSFRGTYEIKKPNSEAEMNNAKKTMQLLGSYAIPANQQNVNPEEVLKKAVKMDKDRITVSIPNENDSKFEADCKKQGLTFNKVV